MPVLEAGGFEATREFNPPHPLLAQHGEDRADVLLRAGQQVVVQDIASRVDRQFPQRSLPFRHCTEPAVVGAASGGDDVSGAEVAPRDEIASGFSRGRPAHSDRGHFRPGVGEEFRPFHVPGEGHRYMHLINIAAVAFPGRHIEKGQIIGRAGFGSAWKHPCDSHANSPPSIRAARLCRLADCRRPPPG